MTKKERKSISNIKPFSQTSQEENNCKLPENNYQNDNEIFQNSKNDDVLKYMDNNQDSDYQISLTDEKQNDQYYQYQSDSYSHLQNPPIPSHNYTTAYKQSQNCEEESLKLDFKIEEKEDQIPNKLYEENKLNQEKKQNNKEQIIEKKITELNSEIIRFKEEKEKVDTLKAEYEKMHFKLQKDIDDLNSRQANFDEWKEEEMGKIQKEKKKLALDIKQFTNTKQSAQNMQISNKKDKEQIETLKNQIAKIQGEFKQKENTSKLLIEKLKKQIEELSQRKENTSLINHQPQLTSNTTHHNERARSNSKTATKIQKSKTGKIEIKKKNLASKLNNISNSHIQSNIENESSNNLNNYNSIRNDNDDNDEITKNANLNASNVKITPRPIIANSKNNNINHHKQQGQHQQQPQTLLNSVKYQRPVGPQLVTENKNIINSLIPNEDSTDNYDFILPEKYHGKEYHLLNQETSPDGKIIRLYNNDKREVIFQSGVRKEIYKDGYQIVYFSNGDLKQVFPDNKSVYYFKEAKTVQTTFGDGLQVFKFNNGQIEKHFTDGTKRISFPDGSIRNIMNDGYEETYYSDGTIQKIGKDNVITIEHQDGYKEIKYPDGREECSYPDDQAYEEDN